MGTPVNGVGGSPRVADASPMRRDPPKRCTAALSGRPPQERVARAERYPARDTDLVEVYTEACGYPFTITADHILEALGPSSVSVSRRGPASAGPRARRGARAKKAGERRTRR